MRLPHIVQCLRDHGPGVVLAWLIIAAVGVLVR